MEFSEPIEEAHRDPLPDRMRWFLYALLIPSGAAALIHQVAWGRAFTPIFGSTTRAAAVVVSAFFLGMAIGNLVGGRLATDRRRALLAYAVAELVAAAGALVVMVCVELYRSQYPAIYAWGLDRPTLLLSTQLALAFLAMGLGTIAMGATLPLIIRVLVGTSPLAGRQAARVYAINTVGATIGALLAGFAFPVALGTRGSVGFAAVLNIAIGIGGFYVWVRVRRAHPGTSVSPVPGSRARTELAPAVAFVAAASGLGMLALEVLYVRLLVNSTDGSAFSFALILAVFLAALAVGSWIASAVIERRRSPWRVVALSSLLAAVATLLVPPLFFLGSEHLPRLMLSWGYWGWLGILTILVVGPSVTLAGITLPAIWRLATSDVDAIGQKVGRLTSINTFAGVIGSLGAGFVLIPLVGVMRSFAFVASIFALVAMLAWLQTTTGVLRWTVPGVLGAAFAGIWFALGSWMVAPLALGPGEQVLFFREGGGGAVAVTRLASGVRRLRINDSYILTSSAPRAQRAQRAQARFAMALVDEPRSVAFIGVGGGITISAVTEFPSIERVVAMELVPGVVDAAAEFSFANRGILDDPRVEVVAADGRNHLYGSQERYDVVVGEVFAPWHAGTGYLYTAEHFQTVSQRLSATGVFVQWFQTDQISLEELRIVAGTFADAFVTAELWIMGGLADLPFVGLVGHRREAITPTSFEREDLEFACRTSALRRWARSASRNTDDRPHLEYRSARDHLLTQRKIPGELVAKLRIACSSVEEPVGISAASEDQADR